MVEHVSELITVAGAALVVGATSQVLIAVTTSRKRICHERERIARLMLDDGAESWTAHGRTAAKTAAGDPSNHD